MKRIILNPMVLLENDSLIILSSITNDDICISFIMLLCFLVYQLCTIFFLASEESICIHSLSVFGVLKLYSFSAKSSIFEPGMGFQSPPNPKYAFGLSFSNCRTTVLVSIRSLYFSPGDP